jgi:hypothetical protein
VGVISIRLLSRRPFEHHLTGDRIGDAKPAAEVFKRIAEGVERRDHMRARRRHRLVEDEIEASEQWEVNAATAHDAVKEATAYIRFPPHHVEAKLCLPTQEACEDDLRPGEARRYVQPL